jgi:hypothetical protein
VNRLFTAEWCYTEFPWGEDKEMEQWLKDSSPFREVRHVVSPRYSFNTNEDETK